MTKSQVERNREYRQRLKEVDPAKYEEFKNRVKLNSAKSFIRKHATNPQLKDLDTMIHDKLKPWSTINTKREGL